MKRAEVRAFIESGITAINADGNNIAFNSGRITEFNSNRSNTYPYVWLESLSVDNDLLNSLPINNWNIAIHVAKKDHIDSKPEQYEVIIDDCDLIAQKLIKKYNDVVSGYKLITITGSSREPFIKKHADLTTGVVLSFVLNDPDTTNLCE